MLDTVAEALMEIACDVREVLDENLIWRNKFEVLYQGLSYLRCKRPGLAAHCCMSWNDPEGKCMLLARNGIELHEGPGGRVITLARADRHLVRGVLVGQFEDGYWYWEIF